MTLDEDLMNEMFTKNALGDEVITENQFIKVSDMTLSETPDGFSLSVMFDLFESYVN